MITAGSRRFLTIGLLIVISGGPLVAQPAGESPGVVDLETDLRESANPRIPEADQLQGIAPTEAFVEPPEAAPEIPTKIRDQTHFETPTADGQLLTREVLGDDDLPAQQSAEVRPINRTPFWSSLMEFVSPTTPNGRDNFTFSLGTSIGYDTNVLYSATNRIGSATASAFASLGYVIGTPRFELTGRLDLRTTQYENRPGGTQDDSFGLVLATRYQFRPRLNFLFESLTGYRSVPSVQQIGGVFTFTGPYFFTDSRFSATYLLRPNISVVAGYSLYALKYDDELVNEQSGFTSQTFSLTGNWLLTPRTTALIDYRYNPVSYYASGEGTQGHILLFGISQSVTPRFEWTLEAGGEFRAVENPSAANDAPTEYLGPFVEGEATYLVADESEIGMTLRYGTEPAGVSGITIRQTFRMGLNLEHTLGPRLSVTSGINFQRDIFDQPGGGVDTSQDVYSGFVALRYQFNPTFGASLGCEYLQVATDVPNSSYDRSVVSAGVDITF